MPLLSSRICTMFYIQHVTVSLVILLRFLFVNKRYPLRVLIGPAIYRTRQIWLANRIRTDWGILLLFYVENALSISMHRKVEIGLVLRFAHLVQNLLVAHFDRFGATDASAVVLARTGTY